MNFTYDSQGQLTAITDTAGRQVVFTYDNGLISSMTDPLGLVFQFEYDADKNLSRIVKPDHSTVEYQYDGNHRITQKKDEQNVIFHYSYQTDVKASAVANDLGQMVFSYQYPSPQKMTRTDANGFATTFTANDKKQITEIVDELGRTLSFEYDDKGNQTKVIANGQETSYSYDDKGNVLSVTDPLGRTRTVTYNDLNLPVTVTDFTGRKKTYTYDGKGNLLAVEDAAGRKTQINNVTMEKVISLSYDAVGNLTQVADPEGLVSSYQYNALNQVTQLTDPDGNVTRYLYDEANRVSERIAGNGVRTSYRYDANGQIQSIVNTGSSGLLSSLRYTYDAVGNPVSQIEEDGATTTYGYDALNRLLNVTYPKEKIEAIRNKKDMEQNILISFHTVKGD